MLRFRGKDVLRISKYNMLMFIILGLLGLGISVGYLCRHVPAFKGLEQKMYLQPIITQYFIDNKSEIWLLFLIAHSKR